MFLYINSYLFWNQLTLMLGHLVPNFDIGLINFYL